MSLIEAILSNNKEKIFGRITEILKEKLAQKECDMMTEAFKTPKNKKPNTISQIKKNTFQKKRHKKIQGFKIIRGKARKIGSIEKFRRKYGSQKGKIKAKLHQRIAVQKKQRHKAKQKTLGLGE